MRIIAFKSFKNGILSKFGEGKLIKNQIPDIPYFSNLKMENPCIKLDSGKYVWGFECWWQELAEFNKIYKKDIKEIIDVEPQNIYPI